MKSEIRTYLLLFLGCLLFHVLGTWSLPLIDRDEPRFAEASREMRQRHDYIVPYFNDHYRFDKPPFTYWAQVASYRVFGDNDFGARFPSAVAAALTAALIFAWGSRLGGNSLGWWAVIVFTLSLQTFVHAKAAVADMWLVLFVTLAHWAGYELLMGRGRERPTSNPESFRDRPSAGAQPRKPIGAGSPMPNEGLVAPNIIWWSIFYIALALAFLAKGPIGWVPLLTVGAARFFAGEPQLSGRFKFGRGILLMLVLVSLWGIPALIRTHGEFFSIGIGRHVIRRSFGTMEGHGASSFVAYLLLLPFYFVTLFASFFPWSIKLPSVCRKLWRERDAIDSYLLAGIAVVFVIFTLVKTKLPHYTLPAFPLLALLLTRSLVGQTRTFLRYSAITATAVLGIVALAVPPLIAPLFPARQLFEQAQADLRPEMEFAAVEFSEPSLVWYFRSRVGNFMTVMDRNDVASFMNRSGPRFAILPTAAVPQVFPRLPSDWKVFSTQGFNVVKGKKADLTLILKSI
ncbi:MAG: hypothetical protein QOG67_1697 [Verrucomicrobiota bacterium]